MASKVAEMGLILAVAAMMMLWKGATAQSNSCTSALIGLTPCLTYVTGNSSAPSSSCCTQLSGVVQSNPQCLCLLLNGGGSNLGVNINQSLALALPAACKVQTPPVSQCNAAVPASSPVGSQAPPTSEPKETPQVPNTPAGSKTVPSTTAGGPSSAADGTAKASFRFLGFLVFAATLSMAGFGI
ncbi:PREDICTED: non-specific lipid-transfer protein-like protein At2g13820 [Ipomoea nil]|uniref:non-specific lipid-transfer protein-like protein At2g13820 n=1 Tax=Ipomoea nil TaxID=35883 RepID=UPI000900FE09|nr:PREDICTED: non-specific lipid-transfer protein-like protein At2g13820 [Ipomoea nil]